MNERKHFSLIEPSGHIVTSRFTGDVLAVPRSGDPLVLSLPRRNAPADRRLWTLSDGSSILAVPEQARTEPEP